MPPAILIEIRELNVFTDLKKKKAFGIHKIRKSVKRTFPV